MKLSIITASYNSGKTIEQTIKSVINQTYSDIEFIIIDGGSTDQTLELIRQYSKHIDYFISEKDNGIFDAFNKGVRAATGEVIYFLNSDDYFYHDDVAKIVMSEFATHKVVVHGNVLILDEKTQFKFVRGKDMCLEHFRNREMLPHQGAFVKKTAFDEIGFFDESFNIAADSDFLIKCFKRYKPTQIKYINEIISIFRVGGVSSDLKMSKKKQEELDFILNKHFPEDSIKKEGNYNIDVFYRIWLESILLQNKGISHQLYTRNIKKVAIFGILKTAMYLKEDLKKENIGISVFIDNNMNMVGKEIEGISIVNENWIPANLNKLDAIIVSIENSKDYEVMNRLKSLVSQKVIILSWKELILSI